MPVVWRIESAVQLTQGLSTSVRDAAKRCVAADLDHRKAVGMQMRAHGIDDLFIFGADDEAKLQHGVGAVPGIALAGFSILPDDIASTSSVFQA